MTYLPVLAGVKLYQTVLSAPTSSWHGWRNPSSTSCGVALVMSAGGAVNGTEGTMTAFAHSSFEGASTSADGAAGGTVPAPLILAVPEAIASDATPNNPMNASFPIMSAPRRSPARNPIVHGQRRCQRVAWDEHE